MRSLKAKDIKREWHLIDAKDKVLGRLSTEAAMLLMGKNKPYYTPHLDCGDYVVVINAKKVALTGKKENQKTYYHHSGYPGGLKSKTAKDIRAQKPQLLVKHAVVGMLPKTKLGKLMLKKLYIYEDEKNPHQSKIKTDN